MQLDLICTNISEYQSAVELSPICNNDHCTILLKINKVSKTPKYIRTNRRLITAERKSRVLCDIAKESWDNVLKAESVHDKVEALQFTINSILNKHCPFKVRKIRRDRPGWITPGIEKLIRARDKAYQKRSKSWKVIRAIVRRRIRSSKRSFIADKLNSNQNTKEWWATLNTITKPNSSKKEQLPTVDGKAMTPSNFCDKLNSYYASVGGPPVSVERNGHAQSECSTAELSELSIGEVKHMMSKLNVSKATSSEDFPCWVSLEGREDICVPLCNIINSMLKTAEFPDKWKKSQIRPIPKTSNPTTFRDYRPVSLLFHLGKLSEQVIIDKLRPKLEKIIEPSQFAYQPKLGTVDALIKLIDDFTAELDNPGTRYVQSAALDFSKAFDRLQPDILLDKMENYKFNKNSISLVSSFLQNRKQSVKYGDSLSTYISSLVGAPQGTKLGPILWLLYSNDLSAKDYNHIKYADDTTFYTPVRSSDLNPSAIAPAVLSTQQWATDNSMMLNADKTEVMNTCLSYKCNYDDDVVIDDLSISPSPCTKFLGVFIDNKLSFNQHVDSLITKCNSRVFLLRKLRTIGLDVQGLKTFYFSNIRSVISYAAQAWFSLLGEHNRERLEKIQRSCTKIMLPESEYPDRLAILNMTMLSEFLFELSLSHFNKIRHDEGHPLFDRLVFNKNRTSSRVQCVFRPKKCRTEKRSHSFSNFL